jgi:hypothetical protein
MSQLTTHIVSSAGSFALGMETLLYPIFVIIICQPSPRCELVHIIKTNTSDTSIFYISYKILELMDLREFILQKAHYIPRETETPIT